MAADPATLTGAQAMGLDWPASMTSLAILQVIAPGLSPIPDSQEPDPQPTRPASDKADEAIGKVNPLLADLYL